MKRYFISFVEEFWVGQKKGTWIGRMEYYIVGGEDKLYPDEIGMGTFDREGVERLRERYDFKEVSGRTLKKIIKEIERLRGVKECKSN